MPLIASSRRYVISCTTAHRRAILYPTDNNVLQAPGDEGLTEGSPPITAKSGCSSLNNAVLSNSGKIKTIKDVSSRIVDLKKSKGNIMTSSTSRKSINKHNTYLGRQGVFI